MAPRPQARTARLLVLMLATVLVSGLVTTTAVSAGVLPSCRVADVPTAQRSLTTWSTSVLDTTYRLTSDYVPHDLRSTVNAGLNGGNMVRAFVIPDLRAMARAARAAGARLAVESAYRSYGTQKATFAYWTRVSGYAGALKGSARAGHSEHQLGTTLDFKSYGRTAPWNYRDWGTTKAGAWLRNNAWKYGFIMSYPKGKSSVTCYQYEPWHFRYVGRATAAEVHASGMTLRQFLWNAQSVPAPTPTPTATPTPTPTPDSSDADPTPTPDSSDAEPTADPDPDPDPHTDTDARPQRRGSDARVVTAASTTFGRGGTDG